MSTDTSAVAAPWRAALEPVVFPTLDPAGASEGFALGHSAGYAVGLRRAAEELAARKAELESRQAAEAAADRARVEQSVAALAAAARALEARSAPVLAEADTQLVAAALSLAETVLGCELSDGPNAARRALRRALSAPDASAVVTVRLHPDDAAVVREEAAAARVAVVVDPSLHYGDAVAVYPDGELDARIGSALARARAALVGESP